MEKLKPCPFCGGEVKTIYYYDGIGDEYFGVHCERCRFTYGAETEYKRNTVNRWNRRMTDWIKTSERLPRRYDSVLFWIANNGDFEDRDIQIGWLHDTYSGLGVIWETESTYYKNSEVTYWMPLPELPEVEEC